MAATRPTYTATFKRADNGAWVAELAEQPNVHAYGTTLAEARRNIRDAVNTLFGPFGADRDGFELVEDVRLPDAVLNLVNQGRLEHQRAGQQLAEARVAEEGVAALTREALAVTREAARMLVEHGVFVEAQADDVGLVTDIRMPEAVMVMIERAHQQRQTANYHHQAALVARESATMTSSQAVATLREAVRLLVGECGLAVAEAAGLLSLSPERAQRLLAE